MEVTQFSLFDNFLYEPQIGNRRNKKMPKLSQHTPATQESFELVWVKATVLAETSERFCIDAISKGTKPDDYGNMYWFVRAITDNQPEGTRTMVKFQQGSQARDSHMLELQQLLKSCYGADDHCIHFVYVKQLAAQKGKQGATVLATEETEACSCGYYNDSNPNTVEGNDLGELDDHPF